MGVEAGRDPDEHGAAREATVVPSRAELCPPSAYGEAPAPQNVTMFADGVSTVVIKGQVRSLPSIIKEDQDTVTEDDHVRSQREDSIPKPRGDLWSNQACDTLISRTSSL